MIGIIIYIALQIVFIAALPASEIGSTWAHGWPTPHVHRPVRAAGRRSSALGWLATILYIDAIISPAGTGLIYTTGDVAGHLRPEPQRLLPEVRSSRPTSRGVPWVGLITAFVVGCICFLPFPSWQSLVGLITSASVLMYAGAPLVARRVPQPAAGRRPAVPAAGGAVHRRRWRSSSPTCSSCGRAGTTDWKLGIAILIGYVILIANRVFKLNPITPESTLAAAQWLPVYLVGMGLIVFLSDFGPLDNPWFPLWWDMVAVAVFCVGDLLLGPQGGTFHRTDRAHAQRGRHP